MSTVATESRSTPTSNGKPPFAEYLAAGLSVVPIRTDGSKKPAEKWKRLQSERASIGQGQAWAQTYRGVALIGGKVSGNLECVDVDQPHQVELLFQELRSTAPGLIDKLTLIQTPRCNEAGQHGLHLIYRCAEPADGNTKLAMGPPEPEFDAQGEPIIDSATGRQKEKPATWIETRGEGGYFLTVGSAGSCHETGNTYEHIGGPPLTELAVLTGAERRKLHAICRQFNWQPEDTDSRPTDRNGNGQSPGDAFNERATWADAGLEAAGWKVVGQTTGQKLWRRPGKGIGHSATTGLRSKAGNELFICFSSNAHPFESTNTKGQPGASYSKFAVYTLLNHGGDFSAAARELASQGYGNSGRRQGNGGNGIGMGKNPTRFLPYTDSGLAERFARQHGENVRYCYPWKKWLAWDGQRWKIDDTGQVERLAKLTVRSIIREAADCDNDNIRKALLKFARDSESASSRGAMLRLARSEPPVPVLPNALDTDSWLLNCENGTIDLKTGELRPHRREDMLTKLAPVPFDPQAECPEFTRFLRRVFEDNTALVDFMQRLVGYCLTGLTTEQILSILYGVGANGKSTLVDVLLAMLGTDYAMQAGPDLLMVRRNEQHPTALADLHGKRIAVCCESEEGARLAESLVKQLTGGDRVRARRMREDNWEFEPTHKVFMVTNHKPEIHGTDYAIWRRIRLVPFDVIIPKPQQDKQLPEKLRAELPGILAWAVRGCLDWKHHGLGEPAEVLGATENYRAEQDLLGGFLRDCCVVGEGFRARAGELFDAYRQWSGDKKAVQRRFGTALRERGFKKYRNNGIWWEGVGLVETGGEERAG